MPIKIIIETIVATHNIAKQIPGIGSCISPIKVLLMIHATTDATPTQRAAITTIRKNKIINPKIVNAIKFNVIICLFKQMCYRCRE
jgi:hypothetical protein